MNTCFGAFLTSHLMDVEGMKWNKQA